MSTNSTPENELQPAVNPAQTPPDAQDRTICLRSVKTSCWLGLLVFLLCYGTHHTNWAWGFFIGALLSLFSMISLMLAVPFLTWSGAPRHMSALMIVTLFMKLPIFCIGLYLATHLPGVSAFACCAGICLTPVAITIKAVGNLIRDFRPARQPEPQTKEEPKPAPPAASVKPVRRVALDFVPEQS